MRKWLIDTHTHYTHKRFDSGREDIIKGLNEEDILAVVEAAIEFESNQRMKSLCERYPHVYMAAGCHPNCVEEMDDVKYQQIAELLKNEKVIAVGETGLDYARDKSESQINKQKEWFQKFLLLAINTNKPLVIHAREAYDDLIMILRGYNFMEQPGVIHCFNGNLEQARELMDMGFYIGVNGMFTNMDVNSDVCVALRTIPLERILLETDSPYLLPNGAKGKRNTSANLRLVVNYLSELRGESPEYIQEVALENTRRLYPTIYVG